MNDKDTTRRQFMELMAAGSVGATVAGLGLQFSATERAQAADLTTDRSHYKIFSPGHIGKMKLKNRIVRSAAFEGAGAPTGEVSDAMIRFHRAYAEGGVSLTLTGYMAVMEYGKKSSHVCAYDDRFIPGLKKLADAVHAVGNDCKIGAEIGHDGTCQVVQRDAKSFEPSRISPAGELWPHRIGPSGINWRGEQEGHVMTEAEIERFCSDMGHAARRLQEAGFDAVDIHGAHHYLIDTFISPFTNRRTDQYGGSLKNRVRIVAHMVERMREHVGRDFPILIKLNCDDGPTHPGIQGEVEIHSFPAVAREVVKAGVDAIDISGSQKPGDPLRMNISDPKDQSFYLPFAEALDVKVPVILGCGNRNVELLEKIIQHGKVDFFCFARPMVREPDLARRWLEGLGNAAADCINSNLCFRRLQETGEPVRCVVLEQQQKAAQARLEIETSIYGV
jgi:2,4-dienoyl-CoA reductase-like NADH-dependent reductase (Old Yellow Enzyme family)